MMSASQTVKDRPQLSVRLNFDGGCRNNPNGPAAGGAVITDLEGNVLRHVGKHAGIGSNNVGEWTGLVIGLEAALALGATHVDAAGDSQLVVRQFNGEYAIKVSHLQPFARQAHAVAAQFARINLTWIRRENNKAADSICTAVLDGYYRPTAATLIEAVSKTTAIPAVPTGQTHEISVTFTCTATMDPTLVREARAAGRTTEMIVAQFAAEAERRLSMAGKIGELSIVPKRKH